MLKKVLVADDNAMNRQLLCRMLRDEYDTLEAVDGKETLELLRRERDGVSAVLLDIIMPEMDGYEVLEHMRADEALRHIPVIVTTGSTETGAEVKALALGANDYIMKPYSADIIRMRLWNAITPRQTASIANLARRDDLTGLFNRRGFFEEAAAMVAAKPEGYYVMACFDVDGFKVVNDQYGTPRGDEVLRMLADSFVRGFSPAGGVCCRLMADNFAVLYPREFMETSEIAAIRDAAARLDGAMLPLTFSIGRYVVDDLALPVSAMCDRASVAKASIKGRYDKHVAMYTPDMLDSILREREITGAMNHALSHGQFEVWFQPQYNHSTGALIGAEALVRWNRPGKGIVPPGEFVPVFERNGFIYELDRFVWERCCSLLRRWLDEGRDPLPVSVNISRYDIFCEDMVDVLCELVERYRLPAGLLRLEITESAFSRSTEQIISTVRRLVEAGFTVEIDDFGSGYSSLNTLKDVPASVVKLDMRFLGEGADAQRGGNILESVVRMAKWLGMTVIAEGVETFEQANYLESIGSSYVQGYLYARPMTAEDYGRLMKGTAAREANTTTDVGAVLSGDAFWSPESIETLVFNSYVGGACVFEYHDGNAELVRANEKFVSAFAGEGATAANVFGRAWGSRLSERDRDSLLFAMKHAVSSRGETTTEVTVGGRNSFGRERRLCFDIRAISSAGERSLIYCAGRDVTDQRAAEDRLRQTDERLRFLNDAARDLLTDSEPEGGVNGMLRKTMEHFGASRAFVLRYGRKEDVFTLVGEVFARGEVHLGSKIPGAALWYWKRAFETSDFLRVEDVERLGKDRRAERDRIVATGSRALLVSSLRAQGKLIGVLGVLDPSDNLSDYENLGALGGYMASVMMRRELMERIERDRRMLSDLTEDMPGGFARFRRTPDGVFHNMYVNESFCRKRGMSREEILELEGADAMHFVHPDDVSGIIAATDMQDSDDSTFSVRYRLLHGDGEYVWYMVNARMLKDEEGALINVYYSELPEQQREELTLRELLPSALAVVMQTSEELSFIKDSELRYICASLGMAKALGMPDQSGMIGKTDYELVDKELADRYSGIDREIIKTGKPQIDYIERQPDLNGGVHYASTSKYPLCDRSGAVVGIYGVGRDVTDTRESLERLRMISGNIPGGLAAYSVTRSGISVNYQNDRVFANSGYSREEYTERFGNDPLGIVVDEDRAGIAAQAMRLLDGENVIDCTYRIHDRNGRLRWLNLRGEVAERQADGVTVNVIIFDISELRGAQEARRIHDEEMRMAMGQMGKLICEYDPRTRTLVMPENYAECYGCPATLEGVPECVEEMDILSSEDYAAYRAFYESILAGEKTGAVEVSMRRTDGTRHWQRMEFAAILDSSGKTAVALVTVEDATGRHDREVRIAAEMEAGERRMHDYERLFFDAASGMYSEIRKINLITGRVSDLVFKEGQPIENPLEQRWGDCYNAFIERVHPDDRAAVREKSLNGDLGDLPAGDSVSFTYRSRNGEGEYRWYTTTVRTAVGGQTQDVTAFTVDERATRRYATAFTVDINDEVNERSRLKDLSEHDGMTDLFNRIKYDTLRQGEYRALSSCGVIFFDVNYLKQINDTRGHEAGDALLCMVADSIRSITNRRVHGYRFGGDEFLVVACDMQEQELDRLLSMWSNRLRTLARSNGLPCDVAVGRAWSGSPVDLDELVRLADERMYANKADMKRSADK